MLSECRLADRSDLLCLGAALDEADSKLGASSRIAIAAQLLRVRDRGGKNIALRANKAQEVYEENRKQRNIILKARQLGMTTWIAGQFFLRTITHPGALTVQVAHTQEAAESIFRIVHRFFRCLPQSMRQGALRTSQVNARQILFSGIDSEYRVETAGAPNAGRGLTITNLHCSEVARWPGDAAEILHGLRAALSPAGELVLESTPMGAAGCFWKEWQEAPATGIARHFFPWWLEDAYRAEAAEESSMTEVEQRLVREHGLTPAQIGYRRQIGKDFRGLAPQEFAEDPAACFLASGQCLFDTAAIDSRLRELTPALHQRAGGRLQIWRRPMPARDYLIAVDPAGGGSEGDYSAVQVIDLATSLQCAEFRGRATPLELAGETSALAREYNGAVVAVERNNHGSGVLAYLETVCRCGRVYQSGGQPGWLTSAVSRPRMLARLGSALVETPEIFSSERLLLECRTFVRHPSGRVEAQSGEHDDCVMAMAIALAVRDERLACGSLN